MTGRLPGWGRALGLALAAGLLSVVPMAYLVFLPLALMFLALPPRRPALVVAGVVMAAVLLAGRAADPVLDYGRGWALVVGAWFVIGAVMLGPRAFLVRGLFAVAAATLTAGGLLLLRPGSFAQLDAAMARRSRAGAEAMLEAGARLRPGPDVVDAVYLGADLQSLLYPALLAGASLAGLAVAWWAYRRVAVRDRQPLRPLGEFRFPDVLVWLVVAAAMLMLLPWGDLPGRAGSNLLVFMALLYALRGLGVVVGIVGLPGPLGLIVVVLVGLLLYPLVMGSALLIGLTDTWLDLRTRWRGEPDAGA